MHPIRSLDLSAIDAVGFDLDHTIALYDDESVNRLAAEETLPLLKQIGYSVSSLPFEIRSTDARGLSMDLRHGNVLKIAADGRVRLARCGSAWLDDTDIATRYEAYDPADHAMSWHVYSPFDTPTLWFFSVLGPAVASSREHSFAPQLLRDIRSSLDTSHTRGELKQHLARDLGRYVTAAAGITDRLLHWKASGKQLFVVTNSDRVYATAVLDHVLEGWQDIFDLVVTDASKPRFFEPSVPAPWPGDDGRTHVVESVTAAQVEMRLGVPRERILYAGDNARADTIPARRYGWKTVHVVAELSVAPDTSPWSGALDYRGTPTWFARMIHEHADAACARIDDLLAQEPTARFFANGDFFEQIMQRVGGRGDSGKAS